MNCEALIWRFRAATFPRRISRRASRSTWSSQAAARAFQCHLLDQSVNFPDATFFLPVSCPPPFCAPHWPGQLLILSWKSGLFPGFVHAKGSSLVSFHLFSYSLSLRRPLAWTSQCPLESSHVCTRHSGDKLAVPVILVALLAACVRQTVAMPTTEIASTGRQVQLTNPASTAAERAEKPPAEPPEFRSGRDEANAVIDNPAL